MNIVNSVLTVDTLNSELKIEAYFGLVASRVINEGYEAKDDDSLTGVTNYSLQKAIRLLQREAENLGANAVVGVRVVPESFTTLVYGTAVFISSSSDKKEVKK